MTKPYLSPPLSDPSRPVPQVSPLSEVPWEDVADTVLREVASMRVTSDVVALAAALVVPERCHARYARLHVALLASQVWNNGVKCVCVCGIS